MATATARFSRTVADGTSTSSWSYSVTIRAQSVSAADAAVAWQAAISACNWYGPGLLVPQRPPDLPPRRRRSSRVSHRDRSCSSSGTSAPAASTRAADRACSNSSSACSPRASGSSGISSATSAARCTARSPSSGRVERHVPLVEEQVDDAEHGRRALRQQVRRRHPVRDAGRGDLLLGAHQPLGHRGLRHQERAGDLGRGEPAQRAQRERHLRPRRRAPGGST